MRMTDRMHESERLYREMALKLLEMLHTLALDASDEGPPISFIDSLALTSLSRILKYIDRSIHADAEDFRMRLFISDIRRLADTIAIRLLSSMDSQGRFNYYYPLAFPHNSAADRIGDKACLCTPYDWMLANLESIEHEDALPEDIDSTFSALYALSEHVWENRMPPSRIFALSIKNIESARKPESPHLFNTWFEPEDSSNPEWESADIVAMSSVAAFFDTSDPGHLRQTKSHIFEKTAAFLRNPIEAFWFSDFYHSLPMAMHMLSRCSWTNEQKSGLAGFIMPMLDRNPEKNDALLSPRTRIENDTDRLFYITALINMGKNPCADNEDAFALIGELAAIPFEKISDPLFIHDMKNGTTAYAASPMISALLKFEAIFGLIALQQCQPENKPNGSDLAEKETDPNRGSILSPYSSLEISLTDAVRRTLTDFEILHDKKDMIERLLSSTDFAICLEMCIALISTTRKASDKERLNEFLLAQALGLCTYFLYDKIYDQELHPHALPVLFLTNSVFQMHAQRIIEQIADTGIDIPEDIEHVLTDTDISYFLMARRGGDIPLCFHAKKSIGASLMPMLAMLQARIDLGNIVSVRKFFEHFNLARQISDDAKDAQDDESAKNPKTTTMRILQTQSEIEHELCKEILCAKSSIDELFPNPDTKLAAIRSILQKHLDAFAIKVLRAKWEFSIVKNM